MVRFHRAGARFVTLALLVAPLSGCGEERTALPTAPAGAAQNPLPMLTPVAPTVAAVAPSRGPVGSTIRITGTGFSPGATVTMGDAATNVVVNSVYIDATAPLSASGTVDVIVTNPNGQRAILAGAYTFEIISLTPSSTVVSRGSQLSVTWEAPPGRSSQDWVGFFRVEDPDSAWEYGWWEYTLGAPSGTASLQAPNQPGQYDFRYFLDDGYVNVVRSAPVTVR